MINNVILTGRLTRDPEHRQTANGSSVARFSLAVARTAKEVDFIRVTCWEKTADLAMQYLTKGRLVGVEGHLRINVTGEGDQRREYADVVCNRLVFLESQNQTQATPAPARNNTSISRGLQRPNAPVDDDIPF